MLSKESGNSMTKLRFTSGVLQALEVESDQYSTLLVTVLLDKGLISTSARNLVVTVLSVQAVKVFLACQYQTCGKSNSVCTFLFFPSLRYFFAIYSEVFLPFFSIANLSLSACPEVYRDCRNKLLVDTGFRWFNVLVHPSHSLQNYIKGDSLVCSLELELCMLFII